MSKVCQSGTSNAIRVVISWSFAQWGLDILKTFLKAKTQKKIVIITCEYFTKWVKAKVMATITQKSVEKFVWENIICKFRISNCIIINNGPQLKGDHVSRFYNNLHISLALTSVAHPQNNGQTKATNKNIINSIKNRLEDAKGL